MGVGELDQEIATMQCPVPCPASSKEFNHTCTSEADVPVVGERYKVRRDDLMLVA